MEPSIAKALISNINKALEKNSDEMKGIIYDNVRSKINFHDVSQMNSDLIAELVTARDYLAKEMENKEKSSTNPKLNT